MAMVSYGQASEAVVGPIHVTRERISGPQGQLPAQGARIELVDLTSRRRAIPTWAIVVAIVGFFVLTIFSLLFLLAKEDRVEGVYEVRAIGADGRMLIGTVPITSGSAQWVWNDLAARAAFANQMLASADRSGGDRPAR